MERKLRISKNFSVDFSVNQGMLIAYHTLRIRKLTVASQNIICPLLRATLLRHMLHQPSCCQNPLGWRSRNRLIACIKNLRLCRTSVVSTELA